MNIPKAAWAAQNSSVSSSSTAPSRGDSSRAMIRHTPAITVQGTLNSSSKPVFSPSRARPPTGASRRIHRYLPSRLMDGAAMTHMDRQKPITSAARGITGTPSPIMASIFPRSSRMTTAAAPMPTSIIRPRQEFQKYMGMPNSRRSSMRSRAFFCPAADWADSL